MRITDTRSGVQRDVSRKSWEMIKDKSSFIEGRVSITPTVKVNADEYAEFLPFKQAQKSVEVEPLKEETEPEPAAPIAEKKINLRAETVVKEPAPAKPEPKTTKEKVMAMLDEKGIPYDPTWTTVKLKGLL